jgi:hypothetical protein
VGRLDFERLNWLLLEPAETVRDVQNMLLFCRINQAKATKIMMSVGKMVDVHESDSLKDHTHNSPKVSMGEIDD